MSRMFEPISFGSKDVALRRCLLPYTKRLPYCDGGSGQKRKKNIFNKPRREGWSNEIRVIGEVISRRPSRRGLHPTDPRRLQRSKIGLSKPLCGDDSVHRHHFESGHCMTTFLYIFLNTPKCYEDCLRCMFGDDCWFDASSRYDDA